MRRLMSLIVASCSSLMLVAGAFAGPEWIESSLGAAGDRPPTAQPTGGTGPLGKITGALSELMAGKGSNSQDMYIIYIANPEEFSATTVPPSGNADFDTQLWLFTIDGHGLLGNDDTFYTPDGKTGGIVPGSTLGNQATDPTKQQIPGPGLYLLAISSTGTVPKSKNGPIFAFGCEPGEVSGPDGPGGGDPIDGWEQTGYPTELGDYSIFVKGSQMSGLFLDIKPGGCPNSHNPHSIGVLPVSIVGMGGFDPHLLNVATIVIARADGVGGTVPLLANPRFEDTATPFTGNLCNCHELEGDGIDDLNVRFSSPAILTALQLGQVPGNTMITLEVRGELVDGTPIGAHDCIRIVPPNLTGDSTEAANTKPAMK